VYLVNQIWIVNIYLICLVSILLALFTKASARLSNITLALFTSLSDIVPSLRLSNADRTSSKLSVTQFAMISNLYFSKLAESILIRILFQLR